METRANFVAIGLFVVAVLASALGALYWLYRSAEPGATATLRIVFPEPVTGLSTGGSVLFNGIRVGEVVSLEFPPEGGDNVIAMTRVNPAAPIKTDTGATLSFQGLTGVAYISLTGGSESAPSVFAAADPGEIPSIDAQVSAFTNVVDSAQSVLARLNTTLDEVNGIIAGNREDVNTVVANVRTLTDSLAEAAPRISGLVEDVSDAGRAVADTVPQVSSVIERTDALLAAVEPDRVTTIVENVDAFAGALPAIGEEAQTIVGNVNGLLVRLDDAAGTLGEALRAAADVVEAVDGGAVAAIVANVRTASDVIAERSGAIGTLVDNAAAASGDVRAITNTLAERREAIGTAVDDASALVTEAREAVGAAAPAIESLAAAAAQVTPERVAAILGDVERVVGTFAGQSDAIAEFIRSATAAAERIEEVATLAANREEAIATAIDDGAALLSNLREASEGAPMLVASARAAVDDTGALVRAVDVAALNALVADAGSFADALAARSGDVSAIVEAVAGTATGAERIADALAGRLPQITAAIDDAAATAASARTFADELPALAETVRPGVENVAAALSAVDPDAVAGAVEDLAALAEALGAQAPRIGPIVADVEATLSSARTIADDVAAVSADVAARREAIATAIDDATAAVSSARTFAAELPGLAETLRPGVENVAAVLSAVDPAAVEAIVADVRAATGVIAARGEEIGTLIDSAAGAARRIESVSAAIAQRTPQIGAIIEDAEGAADAARLFAERLPGLAETIEPGLQNASAVLSAIDAEAVRAIFTDAATVADALASNADPVLADVRAVAADARVLSGTLAERAPAIGTTIDEAAAAAEAVAAAAREANALVSDIAPAVRQAAEAIAVVSPERVDDVLSKAQLIASGLAQEAPRVQEIIAAAERIAADVEATAANARDVSARLPDLVDAVEPGIASAGAALEALDAETVAAIQRDVAAFVAALSAERDTVVSLIGSAEGAARRIEAVSAAIAQRTPQIGAIIEDAEATADAARTFVARLPGLADTLEPGLQNASAVLSAIDAEAVSALVADAAAFAEGLAEQREPIAAIVERAGTIAESAETVAATLAERAPQIGAIVERADATLASAQAFADELPDLLETLRPGVENVAAVLSAIDPAAVEAIVADVRAATGVLAARGEELGALIDSAAGAARRIEAVSAAIAQRTPQIGAIIEDAEGAADAARLFAERLPEFADTLEPGIDNAAAVLAAVDPEAVEGLVADLAGLGDRLAAQAPVIESLLANADTAAARAAEIANAIAQRTPQIEATLDEAEAAVASAAGFARELPGLADTLRPGIENAAAVLSAVDPQAVAAIVEDVGTLSSTLAAQAPQVEAIVDQVDAASGDVAAIAARVRGELDTLSAALVDARAALADARAFSAELPGLVETVRPGLASASDTLQALDPEAISAIISDVREVSATLAGAQGNIRQIVDTATTAVRRVEQVTDVIAERSDAIGAAVDNVALFARELGDSAPTVDDVIRGAEGAVRQIRETVAAVDVAAVNAILSDARAAARAVGERAGEIGSAIDAAVGAARDLAEGLGTVGGEEGVLRETLQRARRIAENLEDASERVGGVVTRVGQIFEGPAQRFVSQATSAAASVDEVADAFASRADQIAGGLARFSQGGLDDVRALLDQGQSTLASIERAVSSFQRNPSRVIFGGADAPEYRPQRR